ncbi:MAG: hypothetical protein AAF984_04345 [Verrucomicrobiota bacterium]
MEILTHPGFIGGILGSIVGIIGGGLGMYCSLKRAKDATQKKAIWIFSALIVALVGVFIAAPYLMPSPYKYFLILPYLGVLFLLIFGFNKIYQKSNKSGEPIR